MIELEPHVLVSACFGSYVVELRIGDVQVFHTCGSLKQVWALAKRHLESIESTEDDEPVAIEDLRRSE